MLAKIQGYILQAQGYAKLAAAIVGGLLVIGAQFLPPEWVIYATAAVAIITAFSVYKFPNITTESV